MSEPTTQQVKALLNAADAAVTWWKGKRPVGWGIKKHLSNPKINCITRREEMLALRASQWYAVTRALKNTGGSQS